MQHTSASISLNENFDSDVRKGTLAEMVILEGCCVEQYSLPFADMEDALNRIVPQDQPFRHTMEGPVCLLPLVIPLIGPLSGKYMLLFSFSLQDDMPAHVKTSLFGASLTIPSKYDI